MKPSVCLKAELFDLVRTFNENDAEYALCGSLALAAYGFVRAGEDIDLLVPRDAVNQTIEMALLQEFEKVPARTKSNLISHKLMKGLGVDRIRLDILELPDELTDVWTTRQWLSVGNIDCCMVSREGLMHMKTVSGRNQDRVDVERLVYDDPFKPPDTKRDVDMSSQIVAARIDLASELYALCMFLASGKFVKESNSK